MNTSSIEKMRQVALTFFSAFFGIFLSFVLITPGQIKFWYYYVTLGPAILCFGLFYFDFYIEKILIFIRWIYKKRGLYKIGVINDIPWSLSTEFNRSWTNVHPDEWISLLRKSNGDYKISKIKNFFSEIFIFRFNVLLNPYGGVYNEENYHEQKSLKRILRYIQKGGIYVCIADIPGYYSYDRLIKRSRETAPQNAGVFFYDDIPLLRELGIKIINEDGELKNGKKFARVAVINSGIIPYAGYSIPGDALNLGSDFDKLTPFFQVNYGKGTVIISTLNINHNQHHPKEIVDKIFEEISSTL